MSKTRVFSFHGIGFDPSVFTTKRWIKQANTSFSFDHELRKKNIEHTSVALRGDIDPSFLDKGINFEEEANFVLEKYPNIRQPINNGDKLVFLSHSGGLILALEVCKLLKSKNYATPNLLILVTPFDATLPSSMRPWKPITLETEYDEVLEEVLRFGENDSLKNPEIWNEFKKKIRWHFNGLTRYMLEKPLNLEQVRIYCVYCANDAVISKNHALAVKNCFSAYKSFEYLDLPNAGHNFIINPLVLKQFCDSILPIISML